MNPQYLPPQQYGAASQSLPNLGHNSQGFQSVPLAPPKNGPQTNTPPTSVNSSLQGTQLNNLLGKMPSGNLGPFTVLPQGQKPPGVETLNFNEQNQGLNNNMDVGSMKPPVDIGGNNNFSNGTARNFSPQVQNGPSQNGGGVSIPPSQLPPTSVQTRVSPGAPTLSQNQHASNAASRPPPSFTPSSQAGPPSVPQHVSTSSHMAAPPQSQAPLNSASVHHSQSSLPPNNNQQMGLGQSRMMPPMGQQQFGSSSPSMPSVPPGSNMPPRSQIQSPGAMPPQTRYLGENQGPPGSNQPGSTGQAPSSNATVFSQSAFSGQSQMMGRPTQQSFGPPLGGQPPMPGHASLPGQPPISGQASLPGQPPMPGTASLPGQPPMQGQQLMSGPPSIPGQPPLSRHQPVSGQPPMSGQQPPMPMPGQPPMSMPGQQPMSIHGQPPMSMPGQPPMSMPGQPPISGQQLPMSGQQPMLGQRQMPGQKMPMPGQFPMPGQPPLPGQQPMPNHLMRGQLTNQMQNMSLSGSKPYPGAPQQGPINGENGPHMPPAINGQQMQNQPYPPQPGYQQQPGYPSQPGYPQPPGYLQHPGYPQQAQPKRLDPDQMPSPIQVITDDKTNRSGVFVTNQKGLVPPLVTTDFIVQDQGNASPRFIRSTMYNVPVSNEIMKQTAVPFSLVVSPMARLEEGEYPPPIVNFGELGPVRCIRCKAYMCPFMNFVDSGRRFQCAFCKATTDVPSEYFQHLDHTGQRMDRYERPELVLGTYEFIATADYCTNNVMPKPPAVVFVIDVSYNSIKSGLVHLLCSQMKHIIQNLPVDQGMDKSNMKVGFITYNSSVHFYNIKGTLAAPQMLVVGDTHEMFMPLLDGFLSTPEESEAIIDALMEQIPMMFGDTRETETILLPAILAGLEALKASECAGKLMVFNSNLPSIEAPGKLKNRDDRKLLGTDKERTILTPQNQAYNQLGQDCVKVGCSVDLFLFNNAYIDIATIGQVSRLSGGEVFKYTYFQADIDGDRLIGDIIMDISRPIAFDAIMRVRTSTGIRPTDFYGHFFMANTTDIELAAIDCDKAVAIEIRHDDKLQEEDGVYIQSALLYTSCSGQRRLRICNLSLKTCSQMADLYKSCDLDTVINYIAKQSIYKLMDNNPKAVKDAIVTRAAQVLATYRKNCASPSSAGQLILPECMKLLPLYVNCLLRSDALSGGSDITVDERSFVMQAVMTMDVQTSVHYFYPRLLPLHDIDVSKQPEMPYPIRCTIEKMTEQGVYILENGIHMFLWIGLGANPDFIQKVFGVQSASQVNIEQIRLPELDNPLSVAIRNIIEEIRIQKHRHMRLTLVRQREKLEPVFKHFLVEDRGADASPSYVDFLCHMHKEIRNLLS